jgi:ABC-type uncharacterized transport system substrate-binding protein
VSEVFSGTDETTTAIDRRGSARNDALAFQPTVNLQAAKDLGIVVPQTILLRADKVIE